MNFGPARIEIAIAKIPAARTRSTSGLPGGAGELLGREEQARQGRREPPGLSAWVRLRTPHGAASSRSRSRRGPPGRPLSRYSRESFGDDLQAHYAGPFDEDHVARLDDLHHPLGRFLRVAHELTSVILGELTDGEHLIDAEALNEPADL